MVFHKDFRPGNILISCEDDCYIIDFDGAKFFSKSFDKRDIALKYFRRWNRAIFKRSLPSLMIDEFQIGFKESSGIRL